MRNIFFAALFAASASMATAADITFELVEQKLNATTNPLVFPDAFDVYSIVATNPNDSAVIALELDIVGNFIQAGGADFVEGPENPIVFGFEAPDTFFSLPTGVDAGLALGVDIVDTELQLAGSYTTQGGLDLIPANGSAPIVTISVPAGQPVPLPDTLGRADIGGEFASIVAAGPVIPEPATAMLAGLALVGFAARRK